MNSVWNTYQMKYLPQAPTNTLLILHKSFQGWGQYQVFPLPSLSLLTASMVTLLRQNCHSLPRDFKPHLGPYYKEAREKKFSFCFLAFQHFGPATQELVLSLYRILLRTPWLPRCSISAQHNPLILEYLRVVLTSSGIVYSIIYT